VHEKEIFSAIETKYMIKNTILQHKIEKEKMLSENYVLREKLDFVICQEKEFAKKIKDNYFVKTVVKSPKINLINDVDEYVNRIQK